VFVDTRGFRQWMETGGDEWMRHSGGRGKFNGTKGCQSCHNVDGTKRSQLEGIFGKR
jgi:hypothetical protein